MSQQETLRIALDFFSMYSVGFFLQPPKGRTMVSIAEVPSPANVTVQTPQSGRQGTLREISLLKRTKDFQKIELN